MPNRIGYWVRITGAAMLVIFGGACDRTVSAPEVVHQLNASPPIDIIGRYRELKDSDASLGSRHNRGLDSVLNEIKRIRANKNGRKLTQSEVCTVVADFTISRMTQSEAHAFARQMRIPTRTRCNKDKIARKADRHASEKSREVSLLERFSEDWIDTVFATDSLWTGPDAYPTVHDDSGLTRAISAQLLSALANSTSLSSAESAIASVVSNTIVYDSLQAEWVAEAAALASSSVNYWSANLREWIEQNCPGYDLDEEQYPTTEEGCSSPETFDSYALSWEVPWAEVARVGGADVVGALGIAGDVIEATISTYQSWPRYGRALPGAAAMVRYTQPTAVGMVVRVAKTLARATVMNGVFGAVAGSALAAF